MAINPILGNGIAFPLGLDEGKGIAISRELGDVDQSIRIILSTRPGERVMRPDFGCRLQEMVFRPNNAHTHSAIKDSIMEALLKWEPRIRDLDVVVKQDPKDLDRLNIEINYQVRSSSVPQNLVYPFYLQG